MNSDVIEAHEQVKNGNVMRFIKDYWFIITFILAAAMAWSTLQSRILAAEIINKDQQETIILTASALTALNNKYIEDITYIKTKLTQINSNTQ